MNASAGYLRTATCLVGAACSVGLAVSAWDRSVASSGEGGAPPGSATVDGAAAFYVNAGRHVHVLPFWDEPSPCPAGGTLRGRHPREEKSRWFQTALECVDASGRLNGRSVSWHDTKSAIFLLTHRDGKRHGRAQRLRGRWNEPSFLFEDGAYVDDKKDGVWVRYSEFEPSMRRSSTWTWRKGLLDGPWSYASAASGVPVVEGWFAAGRRTGTWTLYELDVSTPVPAQTLEYAGGKLVRKTVLRDAKVMMGVEGGVREGELREDGTVQR